MLNNVGGPKQQENSMSRMPCAVEHPGDDLGPVIQFKFIQIYKSVQTLQLPLSRSTTRSLRKSLTVLLLSQLNFNQGQLCPLPPAEGAAGGEKGRRDQQEGRRVYSW